MLVTLYTAREYSAVLGIRCYGRVGILLLFFEVNILRMCEVCRLQSLKTVSSYVGHELQ